MQYNLHFNYFKTYFEIPFLKSETKFIEKEDLISVEKNNNLVIPNKLKQKTTSIEANLEKISIYYKNLAYFEISKKGKKIEIKEFFNSESKPLFLSKFLNHVIPFALYQNKKLMVHASGVSKDKKGVLFIGQSGRGKSSLSASLKGFNLISEDSTSVNFKNNKCFVTSGFPIVKLTNEIARHLNFKKKNKIPLPGDRLLRSYYQVNNLSPQNIHIEKCYVLEWGKEFDIQLIRPKEFLANFILSTYSAVPYNSCKASSAILHSYAAKFLATVRVYKLTRNKTNFFKDNREIISHISI